MNVLTRTLRPFALIGLLSPLSLLAQPELEQWGTLRGIRTEGQLQRLEAGLETVNADGSSARRTAHYANPSAFKRNGAAQSVSVTLGAYKVLKTVTETGADSALIEVEAEVLEDTPLALAYTLAVPLSDFAEGSLEWLEPAAEARTRSVGEVTANTPGMTQLAKGLRFVSTSRKVELRSESALQIELPKVGPEDKPANASLRISLQQGGAKKGTMLKQKFTLKVDGALDHKTATVHLDTTNPGRAFLGVGGNFRLQFPKSDPAIIDYNLEHLRLVYSRIALWWRDWDVGEGGDPLASARGGKVTERQKAQMEMARKLHLKGMPVIVSAWDPPEWAIRQGPFAPGTYSPAISVEKYERAAEHIADYLLYLKEHYGVEADMFSFNEPDLGLTPTPAEHILSIKVLGRAFAARGLSTRLLLADTSNATLRSLQMARAALGDPEVLRYVGALGFHTWGGCENENLVAWNQTAKDLSLPLLVSECGSDAEAHKHPQMFLEPYFQLDQIALYVRICSVAQPSALMEWQLTGDYTIVKGAGMYGNEGPLEPTMRFFNYKQLADTQPGAFSLPVRSDHPEVVVAAFGDLARGQYTVHVVNTGAKRPLVLKGIPASVKVLRPFVTDMKRGKVALPELTPSNGQAAMEIDPACFVSLYGE